LTVELSAATTGKIKKMERKNPASNPAVALDYGDGAWNWRCGPSDTKMDPVTLSLQNKV